MITLGIFVFHIKSTKKSVDRYRTLSSLFATTSDVIETLSSTRLKVDHTHLGSPLMCLLVRAVQCMGIGADKERMYILCAAAISCRTLISWTGVLRTQLCNSLQNVLAYLKFDLHLLSRLSIHSNNNYYHQTMKMTGHRDLVKQLIWCGLCEQVQQNLFWLDEFF